MQFWGTSTVDTMYQKGFGSASFSPGSLELGTMVSTLDRKRTSYSLPGGGGGRALGKVPAGITPVSVQALLGKFGFTSNDTVGYVASSTLSAIGSRTPFIQMGSSGHLIVGLRAGGTADPVTGTTDEVMADIQQSPSSIYRWHFPRRVAVIQADVAYEFRYSSHGYATRTIPYLSISQKTQLYSAHYLISKIRNRFGESIDFTYDGDGVGYTATWSTNPSVKIRVQAVGQASVPAGQRALADSATPLVNATQIRVSYLGISQPVSSYLLEGADPQSGGAFSPSPLSATSTTGQVASDMVNFDVALQSIQPTRIVQEASNEQMTFSYGMGSPTTWGYNSVTPTVLKSVKFPSRTVDLTWQAFPFRMNYNSEAWGGYAASSTPSRPFYAYGVVDICDSDTVQARSTGHTRVTPISNWSNAPLTNAPPDQWVNTDFYDVISHPDGSISVHRFASPPSLDGVSGSDGMQNLAFMKAVELEVRYYAPGTFTQADLSITTPAYSSAYKWVVKDRFDVRSVSAPTGDLNDQAVPYPTRVRTWDKESQVLTTEENSDWDEIAFGWKTSHKTSSVTPTPSLTVDYLSLAQQGATYTLYPATLGVYRRVDKTFEPNVLDWLLTREKTEKSTTVQDNTGFLAPGTILPDVQPLLTKTYNASINRVDSIEMKGSDGTVVSTGFMFQGTAGLASQEWLNVYLTSAGLGLSGQLGISNYGYDSNGYLSSISQKPNATTTLTAQQTSDELGRPVTQTDLNGTVRTFSWDAAGRLSAISSSDGDVGTSIEYNDVDHRGTTVTRGAQVSVYRYNGFGELVLDRRKAPDGSWSHRIHGYDAAGRKTGETVWQPLDGSAHENDWSKPYLTRDVTTTTTTPERIICKKWGLDADGNAVCSTWQTIPSSTTTTTNPAAYSGSVITYDGRGRVIFTQDPNLVKTTTEYFGPANLPPGVTTYVGPIRKVSVGGVQTKWFEYDAAGRLVRVTTPVTKNQVITNPRSEYRYDGGDRISEVKQFDEAGRVQVRSWGYNRLGWLTSLVQPENGTTTYSGFTVAGKPTITNYNGRIVRMVPDWMGRPTTVVADDGTVSQSFNYDSAINGKGRPATTSDGGITTTYSYGGQGKRLDSLTTSALIDGITQSFSQSFAYDTYGNRVAGTTSHGSWAQSFHLATGMPNQLTLGGGTVASTPWTSYDPVSWAIKTISYGNGTHSDFSYGTDQMRLAGVAHSLATGGPVAQWTYTYDSNTGNLVRENDLVTGSFDQYGYDEMNRLISALVQSSTYGDQLQQFDYDAFGNRLSSSTQRVMNWVSGTRGAGTATVTATTVPSTANVTLNQADAALWQRNQLPGTTASGAPTGAIYDAQGNLKQIYEKPSDSAHPVTMIYDALGRVMSVWSSRTGVTEKYQYTAEGLRTLIAEYSGTTLQKTRVNLYNDARQMVSQYEKVPAGPLTWKRDITYLGTREAAEFDSAGMHVTMVDHLGSPRLVTGPTGSVESRQKFLPFGELLEQSGSFNTSKGYTNHEQTDASGLIYMQARFYVPWAGRFSAPDPGRDQQFEDTQSWNIYSYVRNSPVMSSDPTGMEQLLVYSAQNGVDGNEMGCYDLMNEAAAQPAEADQEKAKNNKDGSDDYKTAPGVPTPLPEKLDTFVKDLVRESGDNFPKGVTVTGTTNGKHSKGSAHYTEEAVDIRYNAKNPKKALAAGARAGAQFALDEKEHPSSETSGPHFHFQLRPGKGGSKGDLPFRGVPAGSKPPTEKPTGWVSRIVEATVYILSTSIAF